MKSEAAAPARGAATVSGTRSVRRAVAVLRHVALAVDATRLSDIAAALGIDLTTAHRIVRGLCFEGMLRREAQTRRYRLGRLVHELGLAATPHFPLRDLCRPTLEKLAAHSRDSVFLMVQSGLDAVCLERVAGSFSIQAHTLDAGARRPLEVGAGGMAILMSLPDAEVERVIGANAARDEAWERLTPKRMRTLVRISREHGFAINDEELMQGVDAIGLAFTITPAGGAGEPTLAVISIASIAQRMQGKRRDELARELAAEFKRLTRELAR